MQCEEVREQFADYVIDGLPESLRTAVHQHLIGCDSCRTEAADLKALWTDLALVRPVQPGPELRARFDVMLEAYKHGLAEAPPASWWGDMNAWLNGWWPQRPVVQFGFSV